MFALALLVLGLVGFNAAALPSDAGEAPGPRVNGLLVKFRNSPLHADSHRKTALAAAPDSALAAHNARVQHALHATGLGAARQRPFGRAAWHLALAQPLTRAEADRYVAQLSRHADVEWAVPNTRESRLQVPNDPMFPAMAGTTGQWWLHPVRGSSGSVLADRLRGVPGLQTAWSISNGIGAASPTVIAVLDTGITTHPDLNANVLPGYDFVSDVDLSGDGDGRDANAGDPGDFVTSTEKALMPAVFSGCPVQNSSWHGTNVAAVAAAVTDNGVGVAGVNWNVRILPVRVAGKCGADVLDIVDGMYWAAGVQLFNSAMQPLPLNSNPAKIVNISFGGSEPCSPAYQAAIDDLAQRGVVVVAAAGNEHGAVRRPASCNGVVGVVAVNRDGFKAHYSNFGPQVVVATVGGDLGPDGRWGNLLGDDGMLTADNAGIQAPDVNSVIYSRISGTSFAAPIAAGVISLMLSVNPNLTVAEIIAGLRASARPHVTSLMIGACSVQNPGRCLCTALTCGAGLLDAEQALRYAQNPAASVPPAGSGANIDNADVDAAVALGIDLDATATSGNSGGSGGGAMSVAWMLGLMLAIGALWRRRHDALA